MDISDEMISIEDTYKEVGMSKKSNSIEEGGDTFKDNVKNKSMTIIEEEDFEDSVANMNINS
jgi:hypothetical protein